MEDDDSDIKLQRDSASIINDLEASIPLFLYRDPQADEPIRIRKWVKQSNTAKLESMFNAFQEWPQLLDPTLRRHVEPLVAAFRCYVQRYSEHYHTSRGDASASHLVEPLPRAICKLLYTLCKVRGAKVITLFFSNEPSLLEPMLDAFEDWKSRGGDNPTWQERYVILLWLSHLVQTPFDLASISSDDSSTAHCIPAAFELEGALPCVATRLLSLALRYLDSAGKEQEAAKVLLLRLCMRPDMDRLGLQARCIHWSLKSLEAPRDGGDHVSIYSVTGILSFLAGFFKSCDSVSVAPFVLPVLDYTHDIIAGRAVHARMAYGSAAVRKLVIKIHRTSANHLLSGCSLPAGSETDKWTLLGNTIDHLMACLGDKDSPVRFAASKALSNVAQKLDPDMVEQLWNGLMEKLHEDVIVTDFENNKQFDEALHHLDMSIADPLLWQGLILTLSHLLYRHAAPEGKLTMIVGLLVHALDFDQRSSTGTSIGTGVRDAACFGIWSLARKYTTGELSQLPATKIGSRGFAHPHTSVFQLLASELVVTATLDPEGNIRRAASAALQELVGRHPGEIPNGIDLVQIVDYQAVGLRSRAMSDVALHAARLDDVYLYAISNGLLSWRAVASRDAVIRRQAAALIGEVFRRHGSGTISSLLQRIECLRVQSLDEWHGLHLALAGIIRQDHNISCKSVAVRRHSEPGSTIELLREDGPLNKDDVTARGKKAPLASEALCIMISALAEINTLTGNGATLDTLEYHVAILGSSFEHWTQLPPFVIPSAALALFGQLREWKEKQRLLDWLIDSGESHLVQRTPEAAVARTAALGSILQHFLEIPQRVSHGRLEPITDALISRLRQKAHWLVRVAALEHLYTPVYLDGLRGGYDMRPLNQALLDCLDDRSIVNSREVGSEVRTQAVEAISKLNEAVPWDLTQRIEIFGRVHGLAVEKLDKVRESAWRCIRRYPDAVLPKTHPCVGILVAEPERMATMSTSSTMYFDFMLTLCNDHRLQYQMLRGLVTSASSGSEALLSAARIAISGFVSTKSSADVEMFYENILGIIRVNLPAGRLLWPALEVLAFLLDVDIVPRLTKISDPSTLTLRPPYGWQALLDDMAALHKSSNLRNWETVVHVYTGLARYAGLCERIISILRRLLVHRISKVRQAAAAGLFVIQV